MAEVTTSIIAAVAENGVIGFKGRTPWDIPEDLKRFRSLTKGHPVVMGRLTFEAIGRPLQGRVNIVVSKNPDFQSPGCVVRPELEQALEYALATNTGEVFVIGGGQVYAQALPLVSRLHLTLVQGHYQGDTFFPDYADFGRVTQAEPSESGWFVSEKGPRFRYLTIDKESQDGV